MNYGMMFGEELQKQAILGSPFDGIRRAANALSSGIAAPAVKVPFSRGLTGSFAKGTWAPAIKARPVPKAIAEAEHAEALRKFRAAMEAQAAQPYMSSRFANLLNQNFVPKNTYSIL